METTGLSKPGYWDDPAPDFRCNPVGSPMQQGLIEIARADPRLAGHVLVATSGSTGGPKWIALSKRALLASAVAVNAHFGASSVDRWLCALPDFHVGGIGVHARAYLLGQPAAVFAGKWRGRAAEFVQALARRGITLTSLTPAQLFDLVEEKLAAPPGLRAVIVGGGRLEADLKQRGRDLGWPIFVSYGMTEAASQIATGHGDDGGWMPVLPHWQTSLGTDGRLRIRGNALFSGTLDSDGRFKPAPLDAGGWFETNDVVELREGRLRFSGRVDEMVKKLGELVSLGEARQRIASIAATRALVATVMALPDARMGHRLVAVFEGVTIDDARVVECVRDFNGTAPAFARLDATGRVDELPRTALGKIAWSLLGAMLDTK